MCNSYMGMGAPVTHDVSSHRALKKQQNRDIWVSMKLFKSDLQTNFIYINKFTGLTNILTKVRNHKICNFV